MANKKKTEEIIKTALTDLLSHLKVEASIEVVKEDKGDDQEKSSYKASIQTQEAGLLIGRHGETLNSLQLLLGVILYKKTGEWLRVVVDVGGYREAREKDIKEMAGRMASEVETTNQPITLPFLTPLERRIVHLSLSGHQKVTSQSEGVGKNRRVVIKPIKTE